MFVYCSKKINQMYNLIQRRVVVTDNSFIVVQVYFAYRKRSTPKVKFFSYISRDFRYVLDR
ncbi:hypothetical protein F320042A7_42510 [Blautia producta]